MLSRVPPEPQRDLARDIVRINPNSSPFTMLNGFMDCIVCKLFAKSGSGGSSGVTSGMIDGIASRKLRAIPSGASVAWKTQRFVFGSRVSTAARHAVASP